MLTRIRAFIADRRGTIAVTFAVSMFPITALVASAIDIGRQGQNGSRLQAAVDAAALKLARDVGDGKPITDLSAAAHQAVLGNIDPTEITNLTVTAQMDDLNVNVNANGKIVPIMPGLVGLPNLTVYGAGSAVWRTRKIELVLALDNTGSMAGTKIAALKDAARNLINTLRVVSNKPDAVRVGIVPFDVNVNIGRIGFEDQPWMNFSVVPRATWNGCVTDRDQPHDTEDTPPEAAAPATHFHARNCSLAAVQPLTRDWNVLLAKIDQMRATGMTNVTIGLTWAFHLITKGAPFSEAKTRQEEPDLEKIIVLLTDGDNTQNRWTTNGTLIDLRTDIACANVKAAGIRLYTIRVINGDEALLRRCASSPSMYFNVTSASQLNPVFQRIAAEIGQLRLSR